MDRTRAANELIATLDAKDREQVIQACEPVQLNPGESLIRPGRPIDHVYFVESGFLSVLISDGQRDQVEVGLIGREGMAGVSVALGVYEVPFRVMVQAGGAAWRIRSHAFVRALGEIPALQRVVLAYSQLFTTQVAETGRANARQTVESRLARWLLMAHDRLDADELSITHETLSMMLGVRRPGVTVALHVLEGEHMIKARRGTITILDRAKLGEAAKGSYGRPEAEYRRTLSALRGQPAAAAPVAA